MSTAATEPAPSAAGSSAVATAGLGTPPAAPAEGGTVGGLPRSLLVLLGAGGLVLAVAGMRSAADLLAPTFLAITLVITVGPMQQWLVRHRVPGWVVITLSLLVLYALLIGLLAALVLSVTQLIGLLPRYLGQFTALYGQAVDGLDRLGLSQQQITTALAQLDPGSLFRLARTFLQGLLDGLLQTASILVLLATVLFFLVADAVSAPRRMQLAGTSHSALVTSLVAFAGGVRRYWLVTSLFGLIVAVLDVVALYWLGIPLALTWGLLAFITNYIPNVGFVLGVVPPALLGLLEGGVGTALAVVAVYSVLNVVIQVILQPRFTGDAVGLTGTAAFLSLIFWAFVLGPLGALLAIPMTSFVKAVLVDADPRARWVNAWVASSPARAMRAPTLRAPRLPRRRR